MFLVFYKYTYLQYTCFSRSNENIPITLIVQIMMTLFCVILSPTKVTKFFSSESSWTPKTQPNGAVSRRLVEFLVFNSVYWKKSATSNGVNRVFADARIFCFGW